MKSKFRFEDPIVREAFRSALVSFDCRIMAGFDVGTHRVLYCAVEGIHDGEEADALVYYRRAYGQIVS
jgi:flavin reductase